MRFSISKNVQKFEELGGNSQHSMSETKSHHIMISRGIYHLMISLIIIQYDHFVRK